MGNPVMDGRPSAPRTDGAIARFYSDAAWIDGRAEAQLNDLAGRAGVTRVAAFPDLHPGKHGPVGCAVLADAVMPEVIGTDIGCGMALFQLDLPPRKLKLDKALRRIRVLGDPVAAPQGARLEQAGLPGDLFAGALGTIGGGNHFCEVQRLVDPGDGAPDAAVLYLLVHSGSRGLGAAVLEAALAKGAQGYLEGHDAAVRWARLNRRIIAERAAEALRADLSLVADVPHNLAEATPDGWLHRKGAAVAKGLVPLAGSRATASYLVRPLGHPDALGSLAHGAGRRYDRSSMHGRVRAKRSDIAAMERTPFGGRVVCEDRDLLIEEAPLAYKSAEAVLAEMEATGAATRVATMHPLLTFKKTRTGS